MRNPIHRTVRLESIDRIRSDYAIISFRSEEMAGLSLPGNFFEVRAMQGLAALPRLFKPISLYNIEGSSIKLMIKSFGIETRKLIHMRPGDSLEVIGPLGNSFEIPERGMIALISGGIGYPPLFYLRKKIPSTCFSTWIHGGKHTEDIFPCDDAWTEDGSAGNKGLATQGLLNLIQNEHIDMVCACGPTPMLKAVAEICRRYDIALQVSMEAYMACGVGVCHGCSIPIGKMSNWVYKRVCKDGAVFPGDQVRWELI